ncbi:MAG TPA: penicillin-binding transpeptidase domain-containing protein, partial [Gammaproteobacteria bacterium]|nr:penicillin-binding transpeptidase domain-containing protein [Gammaproteobacteria bacterium]
EIRLPDGTTWRPSDLGEPTGKRMTAREGLIYSKNTVTAQVMQEVGPKKTAELARKMGINQSKLDEVPALALGTSPVTPLEMVSAYSTIAASGVYRQPIFITRITDKNGKVLAEFATKDKRVMSEKVVGDLINMLRGAIDQGTGQAVRAQFGLRGDFAGKTGTTQNNSDGWFILMHPRLVAGAWVGFNDPRVTMRSNYWGEGGHNALLLIGDFFQQTLASRLIDGRADFPFDRYYESIWDPYFDMARESFGGMLRDWFGGGRANPAPLPPASPHRNLRSEAPGFEESQREKSLVLEQFGGKRERLEQRQLEREAEKDRLLERLRQKQREQEIRVTD